MGHKYSRSYKTKNQQVKIQNRSSYRNNNNDSFRDLDSIKSNLEDSLRNCSKGFNKNIKLPKPTSKSGKTFKTVVVGGFLLGILGFTIGFPATMCLCLLALFLLLYK